MRHNFDKIQPMKDMFPRELRDIIYRYAYDCDEATLSALTSLAFRNTFMLPVPVGWRFFLHDGGDNTYSFRWYRYLKDIYACPIDMQGVRETLRMINWNAVRYKQTAISEFVKTNTKVGLMARMRRPDQQRNVVHMIWHCLTCCTPSDFTVLCHKNNNYKRFCHVNYFDTPLSYYWPLNEFRRYSLKFLNHLL